MRWCLFQFPSIIFVFPRFFDIPTKILPALVKFALKKKNQFYVSTIYWVYLLIKSHRYISSHVQRKYTLKVRLSID